MNKNLENPDCPCPLKDCPRHGKCTECEEHHHSKNQKTFCEKQDIKTI